MSLFSNELDDIRQRLELVGVSYANWQRDILELVRAADENALTGHEPYHHADTAETLAEAVTRELEGLDDLGHDNDGDLDGQIQGVRDRLIALRDVARTLARNLRS